ncbi:extracellular solute-binding protein [Pseudactinotalea sp.]|uniref:extracellular solute-binding protein n=1 Tax=Pseudactinotalea sp. TaxID=1926260 RepID=UPI003B3A43DF
MTRPITRRALLAAVPAAGLAGLTLASCSTDNDGGGGDAPDGPVELRMTVWSANDGHHAIFNQIADAYIEANPDKVSAVSFEALADGYVDALTTQIAGNEAPDMAWAMESFAAQFVAAGVFTNLTPAFEAAEGYEYDDLIPGAIGLWSSDDGLHGYPFSNSPFGIYVNNDLLAAAGQPDPRDLIASGDWTWDTLMEIAAATAASQGVAGFQPPADAATAWNDALAPMWLSWGASAWSEDGATATFTSEEMVEFFTWYHDQVYANLAIIAPGEEYDFATGQIATRMSQLSASTGLAEAGFAWDFLPLPEGPAGTVPVVGQGGVGVLTQGPNPEIAADFLAFFTNPDNSRLLAQFFPPPRTSLLNVETLAAAAPALTEEQLQGTIIDQASAAVTKPGNPKMSEISDPVRIALDALWTADADVEAALTAANDAAQALLGA